MVTYDTNDTTIYRYMKPMKLKFSFLPKKLKNLRNAPFCPTFAPPVSKIMHFLNPLKLNGTNLVQIGNQKCAFSQARELNLG